VSWPNSRYLVAPRWLSDHRADPSVRVVDTRSPALYGLSHIRGAVFVDVRNLHVAGSGPGAMRAWVGRVVEAFSDAGITDRHQAVFYGEAFGEIAARGVWVLSYLGHPGARLLDGGLDAWLAAGYPTTTAMTSVARAAFRARPRPELVATGHYVLEHLGDPAVRPLDVRRATEYAGSEIRAGRGGHIPGAIHCEWLNNLTERGTYKGPAALASVYADLGL